jgi:hypothetical protein
MSLPEAFYLPLGEDRFEATELTRGPWPDGRQHAGPPAALLGRALEQGLAGTGFALSRITLDVLRALPIATVKIGEVRTSGGARARRLDVEMEIEDRVVMRASAVALRVGEGIPVVSGETSPPPAESSAVWEFPFFKTPLGYHTGVELRTAGGRFGTGHHTVWFRLRAPLVAGEMASALVRTLVAADSANGITAVLSPGEFSFVNPDLHLNLLRSPVGEWIALDARMHTGATGTGLTETRLFDEVGFFGRSTQTLYIEKRT